MNDEMQKMMLDFASDKDVRKAIEELQRSFDHRCKYDDVTTTSLAKRLDMDVSALSRALNGKNPNLKLKTLAKILRGLDKRMKLAVVDLDTVQREHRNDRMLPEIEGAWSMPVPTNRGIVDLRSDNQAVEEAPTQRPTPIRRKYRQSDVHVQG